MILRLFTLVGIVAVIGALFLILPQGIGPVAYQATPEESSLAGYVEAGLFPDPDSLSENEELGHGVFEEPAEDEARIAAAREAMGAMPGMSGMAGMQMGGDEPLVMEMAEEQPSTAADDTMADMPGMQMDGDQPTAMEMAEEQPAPPAGDAMADMPGMQMDGDQPTAMEMAEEQPSTAADDAMVDMPGMQMDGDQPTAMEMAEEQPAPPAGDAMADMPGVIGGEAEDDHGEDVEPMGGDGLVVLADNAEVDREIEFSMREWGYSLEDLAVQPGERIRLTIRNDGNIPHEFMFMPMANMQAIGYRLERADWNLLEHEAPYERSLVLPGQSFQVAIRIASPGAWMFMCMFPYHMQFGMMGQMATPGQSMAM